MDPSPLREPFVALRDGLRAAHAAHGGIDVFLAAQIAHGMVLDAVGPADPEDPFGPEAPLAPDSA
jgi:hypothetical protein